MKITKFEHACFVAEKNGESLVVDPGAYTTDFVTPDNVVGVIITHSHADHLSKDLLSAIAAKNPNMTIVGPKQVVDELADFTTKAATADDRISLGGFEVKFFGGDHAVIFNDMPVDQNLGVLIDNNLYYPGDSFTVPNAQVQTLAFPVAGPWLKFSEAAEFLQSVKPSLAFPTHDAVLSEGGKNLPDQMLAQLAEKQGTKYQRLTEPLEI